MNIIDRSLLLALPGLVLCVSASAQTRAVVINGDRMGDAQIEYLEERACAPIANGHYWLNMATGAWGYAGNPHVEGVLGEACARRPRAKKEMTQRRAPAENVNR